MKRTGRVAYAFRQIKRYSGVAEVASQAVIFYAVLLEDNQIAQIGSASGSLGRVPVTPSLIGAA